MKKIPIDDPVEIDRSFFTSLAQNMNVQVNNTSTVGILDTVFWRCPNCNWRKGRPESVIVRKCPKCGNRRMIHRSVACPVGCFFVYDEEELGPRDVVAWGGRGVVRGGMVEC